MYGSSYSHVPGRYTLEAQRKKQQQQLRLQRSQGKSCGYYMRVVFFFSSLIQSLIIVSLVLFLVYGKKQDSVDSGRISDLEQNFGRVSLENVDLRQQRRNLTRTLNLTVVERLQVDQAVLAMRNHSGKSYLYIVDINTQLSQCTADLNRYKLMSCPKIKDSGECQTDLTYHKNIVQMLQTKLNGTTLKNTIQVDKLSRARDDLSLEAIDLRKDKDMLEMEIQSFRLRCKQDFVSSLSGITNVSRAFMEKIDSLFPHHISFQLTCEKQRENLEQIRSNCTSLSREVVDTLQPYLDSVSTQVSSRTGLISNLEAKNKRLTKDYQSCEQNRTGMILEHRQQMRTAKLHSDAVRKDLLNDKKSLLMEKEVLNKELAVKDSKIGYLQDQNHQLNASCLPRISYGPALLRYNLGSTGLNKPVTNGINGVLNVGSTGSGTGTGLGSTNLGRNNLGSKLLVPPGGRTGGTASVLQQHLQELQRYATGTDKKKKESPKTLG